MASIKRNDCSEKIAAKVRFIHKEHLSLNISLTSERKRRKGDG